MKTIAVTGATVSIGRGVVDVLASDPSVTITAATRHHGGRQAQADRVRFVGFDWDSQALLEST